MPSPGSLISVFELKGQIQRVPNEAAASDHRDASFEVSIIANWIDPGEDAANIAWTRSVWQAHPFSFAGCLFEPHDCRRVGRPRPRSPWDTKV